MWQWISLVYLPDNFTEHSVVSIASSTAFAIVAIEPSKIDAVTGGCGLGVGASYFAG